MYCSSSVEDARFKPLDDSYPTLHGQHLLPRRVQFLFNVSTSSELLLIIFQRGELSINKHKGDSFWTQHVIRVCGKWGDLMTSIGGCFSSRLTSPPGESSRASIMAWAVEAMNPFHNSFVHQSGPSPKVVESDSTQGQSISSGTCGVIHLSDNIGAQAVGDFGYAPELFH
ncbi:hypothetical protein BDN67DRAFT_356910 [Paxillus ammoniavirescens]|nr:hypothetical protein BDN67DRAFT_356910 [Paxillus ammoniavirescens]